MEMKRKRKKETVPKSCKEIETKRQNIYPQHI